MKKSAYLEQVMGYLFNLFFQSLFMKRGLQLFSLFLAIWSLHSCIAEQPDPNPPIVNVLKSLNIQNVVTDSARYGRQIRLKFTARADAEIESFVIEQYIDTTMTVLRGFPKTSGFIDGKFYTDSIAYTVPATNKSILFRFKVFDKKGRSAFRDLRLRATGPPIINIIQSNIPLTGSVALTGSVGYGQLFTFKALVGSWVRLASFNAQVEIGANRVNLPNFPLTVGTDTSNINAFVNYQVPMMAQSPVRLFLTATDRFGASTVQIINLNLDPEIGIRKWNGVVLYTDSATATDQQPGGGALGSLFSSTTGAVSPASAQTTTADVSLVHGGGGIYVCTPVARALFSQGLVASIQAVGNVFDSTNTDFTTYNKLTLPNINLGMAKPGQTPQVNEVLIFRTITGKHGALRITQVAPNKKWIKFDMRVEE